jgi:hypothetical protein
VTRDRIRREAERIRCAFIQGLHERNVIRNSLFDVETRIIERFITPGYEYNNLEIERTDYLPSYGGGNLPIVSHPTHHSTCLPGPSQLSTETIRRKKNKTRVTTRQVSSVMKYHSRTQQRTTTLDTLRGRNHNILI